MTINATLINLYHVCKRELWLHANGIRMEHTSDVVYDGKLLHETSYPQRAEKATELTLSATTDTGQQLLGVIDFYDAVRKVVHETKRSDKVEEAHQWQVKFYLWLLELNGVFGAHGVIEYPTTRQKDEVWLSESDRQYLHQNILDIYSIVHNEQCPQRINSKICKQCSYYDLCYIED